MVLNRNRMNWNFAHWLIMGRSQNWPDLRSPTSKIRDIHFVHLVTLSNCWKFQSDRTTLVARARVWTFSEVGSLNLTWWPDLWWPGAKIFRDYAEKMYDKVCEKRRGCAPPFLRYRRKTWGGGFNNPPSRAKVKYYLFAPTLPRLLYAVCLTSFSQVVPECIISI